MMSLWRQARIGLQYLLLKTGPLTVSAGHAAAFVRTRPELKRPDAQIYFINFSSLQRGGVLHPHSGFTCAVSQLQVESRGSSHIRSADPAAPPSIRYNYLATENDRRVMVEGLKSSRRICNSAADARLRGRRVPARREGGERRGLARVLPRDGRDGVPSDLDLQHGRRGGRAAAGARACRTCASIDASVMPAVPSGNINAAVIAVAEKAADLLKAQ